MSKKEHHSFSNILSVNPYKNTYVLAVASFLNETTLPQYNNEQYVISFLNTSGFINSHISISKNIPNEDLYDAIYNKAYDELGLDQAITYQIQYIETFNKLDEDNRVYQIFIADPLNIEDVFRNTIEKIKYIDYIIPSPLLFKSLYTKEIIEDTGTHCFIYFQENDTSITIYRDKEFLYTKSINFSFKQMHERFCELYGELIEYDEFIRFLSSEDLKTTNSPYKLDTLKLYKEIFANISDILTYVKRALDIDKIDNIYIDSQLQSVSKLDEITEVELGIKSNYFNFDYGFQSSNGHIEHIHYLMHLYTTLSGEDRYECNFTTYHRPPKFAKRESGKAILLSIAALFVAFLYPVSYWTLTYAQTMQEKLLENKYNETHRIKTTTEAIIKSVEADKEKVLTILKKEQEEYAEKKNTLIKIHDVKVNYPSKAELIYILSKDLDKYNVKLETLTYTETQTEDKVSSTKVLKLGLVSSNDKKITSLIEYLTKTYDGRFHFSIEKVSYESESKLYFSELKVSLL